MEESWLIIANPKAGHGSVERGLQALMEALEANAFTFLVRKSERSGHAAELVKEGIKQGFRKIITVGGDGTNNEVVNGILQQESVSSADILYALFPCGTGNDWAKQYQIPRDVAEWIVMLNHKKTFLQDVGKVTFYQGDQQCERYFANIAGMSYDAFVVREMAGLRQPIKNRLAYLIYGLYYVFRYRIPRAKIWIGEEFREGKYYLINAGICRFSGGGMQLVPHAVPDNGLLAITLAGQLSKLGILLNSFRFYNGTITKHPKVTTFQAREIRVDHIDQPVLLEVDGEYLGSTPVVIEVLLKKLQVIVP